MKQLAHFWWHYKQFSFAVAAAIVGGILALVGQKTASHWVLGVASLVALLPLIAGMWGDFRSGAYGLDILALAAIVSAVLLRQYWAAIVVVLMLTGGQSLEAYAERRAKSELDALLDHAPQKATVIRSGKTMELTAAEVHVGDKVLIRPGEVAAVDGLVIEGQSSFDESALTGESLPQAKTLNSQVLSGSINTDEAVTIQATHDAGGSQYQQIIRLVRAAQASQAPFVRLADRYSIPFTVAAFAIAGTMWFISGHAIRFLEVIIVATPCPLLLAAPIAFISGMSRASRYGIIVRTGSALERLADTQTVAFDKTGTLTVGQPAVTSVTAYHGYKQTEVLAMAASLEQNSNHVLARAIVSAAEEKRLKVQRAKHVTEIAGLGLTAHLKGKDVLLGRLAYLSDNGITLPSQLKPASVTGTAVYVAADGKLAGIISFEDTPRPESKRTIKALKALGIPGIMMITGDHKPAARRIASQVGIQEYVSSALPGEKLQVVEAIDAKPVTFVGDGINDAPVLTAADVGIALGARGNTAASESADVVILTDDLFQVARAISLAKHTLRIAKQSILVGLGISLVLMLLFATGKFSPLLGAILQEVVDVVVIFYALRAHRIKVLE